MRLEIFDKDTYERLDIIRQCKYVQYRNDFNDVGMFKIIVPLEEKSIKYLTEGNYIWFEDDILGVIYYREKEEDNKKSDIIIRGFMSNNLLSYRCFEKTYYYKGDLGSIVCDMVEDLAVLPVDNKRKINVLSVERKTLGKEKDMQVTGHALNDVLQDSLASENCGYRMSVVFEKDEAKISTIKFEPVKPENRTLNNERNNPVVFSFDMDNLSSLDYVEDSTEYCNVAYIAGEGQNAHRRIVSCGAINTYGIYRKELYVDARDIQSTKIDDEGHEIVISDEEYEKQLVDRGLERLSNYDYSISLDGAVIVGNKFYTFGKDFFLGDIVTIIDNSLMLEFDLQITSVTKTISEDGDEHFDIKFGKDKITVRKMIKKGGY